MLTVCCKSPWKLHHKILSTQTPVGQRLTDTASQDQDTWWLVCRSMILYTCTVWEGDFISLKKDILRCYTSVYILYIIYVYLYLYLCIFFCKVQSARQREMKGEEWLTWKRQNGYHKVKCQVPETEELQQGEGGRKEREERRRERNEVRPQEWEALEKESERESKG